MWNRFRKNYLRFKSNQRETKVAEGLKFRNRNVTICGNRYFLGKGMMSDVPDILKLDQTAYPEKMKWSKQRFLQDFKNWHRHFYLILRKHDQLVGFICISLSKNNKCGHIENVAVLPDFQGQGLGYLLITTIIERAREMDLDFIDCNCRIENHNAQTLFKDIGFVKVEVKPNHFQEELDAVCLRLHLDKTNYIGAKNFGR